jgi:hypothetical protein
MAMTGIPTDAATVVVMTTTMMMMTSARLAATCTRLALAHVDSLVSG